MNRGGALRAGLSILSLAALVVAATAGLVVGQPGGGGGAGSPHACPGQPLARRLSVWTDDENLRRTFDANVERARVQWESQHGGCRPARFDFPRERYAPGRLCFSRLRWFCSTPEGAFLVRLEAPPFISHSDIAARKGDWNPSSPGEVAHELGHVLALPDDYHLADRSPKTGHRGHLMAQLDGGVAQHETHCACKRCGPGCASADENCP